jgi:hypothetical protein
MTSAVVLTEHPFFLFMCVAATAQTTKAMSPPPTRALAFSREPWEITQVRALRAATRRVTCRSMCQLASTAMACAIGALF